MSRREVVRGNSSIGYMLQALSISNISEIEEIGLGSTERANEPLSNSQVISAEEILIGSIGM